MAASGWNLVVRGTIIWLLGLAFLLPTYARSSALANEVRFDVSHAVVCRDVTPDEPSWAKRRQKLIEATFRVSVMLASGEEEDLNELVYSFSSPERRLRVVDFSPRTETTTDVEGDIEVIVTKESGGTADLKVATGLPFPFGGGAASAAPAVGVGKSEHETTTEKYKQAAERQVLLSAGTIEREHGVFFKLKPSARHSLEGSKEFVIRFVVPASWRGDWMLVNCQATGADGKPLFAGTRSWGSCRVYVGLFMEGDVTARLLSDGLAELQARAQTPLCTTNVGAPAEACNDLWSPLHGAARHVVRKVSPLSRFLSSQESTPDDHRLIGQSTMKKTDAHDYSGKSLALTLSTLGRMSGAK